MSKFEKTLWSLFYFGFTISCIVLEFPIWFIILNIVLDINLMLQFMGVFEEK